MPSVAILGVFFDGYEEVWEDFFDLFDKNWPDCPWKKYIANGKKKINRSGYTVINAGEDAEYSKKIQEALKVIEEDYILILLEDFLLSTRLNQKVANQLEDDLEKLNADYYVMPIGEFRASYNGNYVLDHRVRVLKNKSGYTLSCQPAFWKKDYLKERIGSLNYNAWIFEGVYHLDDNKKHYDFLNKCYVNRTNPLKLSHLIVQGKIIPSSYKEITKTGFKFNTKKPKLTLRESFKRNIKLFLSNVLPNRLKALLKKASSNDSVLDRYKDQIALVRNDLKIGE